MPSRDLTLGFTSAPSSITCISEDHPMEKSSFATSSTQGVVHMNTTLEQKINFPPAPASYTPQGFANKTPAEARWIAEFETTQKTCLTISTVTSSTSTTKYQHLVLENAPWLVKTNDATSGARQTINCLPTSPSGEVVTATTPHTINRILDFSTSSLTILISCRWRQHR